MLRIRSIFSLRKKCHKWNLEGGKKKEFRLPGKCIIQYILMAGIMSFNFHTQHNIAVKIA